METEALHNKSTEARGSSPVPSKPSSKQTGLVAPKFSMVPLTTPIVFVAIFVTYTVWLGTTFADVNIRMLDLYQNAPVLLIALGLLVCLISGQFDLSVGSMATLTAFLIIGLPTKDGWPFWVAFLVCMAVALAGGLLNAFLVVKLGVNAFIGTLATGGIFLGLSSVYSSGVQITPGPLSEGTLPTWFSGPGAVTGFALKAPTAVSVILALIIVGLVGLSVAERGPRAGRWPAIYAATSIVGIALAIAIVAVPVGLPWVVILLVSVAVLLWTVLHYTRLGRHLYATGGNERAARLAGVQVDRTTVIAFIVSAVASGLAGILLAGSQGVATQGAAVPYLLPAFSACFLSTVLFSTGRFHVAGTLLGGFFIVCVSQGLVSGGVPYTWSGIINGSVLVFAVSFQKAFNRARK